MLLSGCTSSNTVSQDEYDRVVKENEALAAQVTELQNKQGAILDETAAIDVRGELLKVAAQTIDENATCVKLNDDTVQITVVIEDESIESFVANKSDEIKEATASIAYALYDDIYSDDNFYENCIIMFLDDNGNCLFGFSCNIDRGVSSFIITNNSTE